MVDTHLMLVDVTIVLLADMVVMESLVLIGLLQCQFLSEFIKQVNFNSSVFGI